MVYGVIFSDEGIEYVYCEKKLPNGKYQLHFMDKNNVEYEYIGSQKKVKWECIKCEDLDTEKK